MLRATKREQEQRDYDLSKMRREMDEQQARQRELEEQLERAAGITKT